MNLTDLVPDQLALISYIDYNDENVEDLYKIMRMGIVPGLEIRKISEISTCAEYRAEGMHTRIAINNELGKHIIVCSLYE